jgi:hypothetical protein
MGGYDGDISKCHFSNKLVCAKCVPFETDAPLLDELVYARIPIPHPPFRRVQDGNRGQIRRANAFAHDGGFDRTLGST